MRTILFRGKRTDGNGWVYGVPYFLNITEENPEDSVNKACIITGVDWDGTCGFMSPENRCFVEVHPETIGQYTGLDDKDGNKIFEGDVVRYVNHHEKGHPYYVNHVVQWSYKYNMWYCFHTKNKQEEGIQGNCFLYAYAKASPSFELIGNIHELL
jgi:uncharacterized phage protein (TIGR01671 family)